MAVQCKGQGAYIRSLREQAGLSIAALAAAIGISDNSLGNAERQSTTLRESTIQRVVAGFVNLGYDVTAKMIRTEGRKR